MSKKLNTSILFLLLAVISCTISCSPDSPPTLTQRQTAAGLIADYPDVLNYKGLPDSASDRSVYIFTDRGAWFGYGLPDSTHQQLTGSFTGPFLMTQDNGVWISPLLSRLEIIDASSGKPVDMASIKIVECSAYSGFLKQVFYTRQPKLLVAVELIFTDSRTALFKTGISNTDQNATTTIQLRWAGDTFMEGVRFTAMGSGIQIQFDKNNNAGYLITDQDANTTVDTSANTYAILTAPKMLRPEDHWEVNLAHRFCFSQEGCLSGMEEQFGQATSLFEASKSAWNNRLKAVFSQLDSAYQTKAHRRIAVKCIQTLLNNWRSPAGFLQHEGLFPSYNYEWFHGFWSWDSWKHAAALAQFDPALAQNQIRAMYDFQDEMGMIADCVYRDTIIENHNWRDTKPPLSAWAAWKVFEKSGDEDFLRELFPKMEKYHQWWYQYRDHDQNGICEYGSTDATLIAAKWESGMDNAVRFDKAKMVKNKKQGGSMNRESVDLNAYLFHEKQQLANIARQLGDTTKADQYLAAADSLQLRLQQLFFDPKSGWFFDIDLKTKKHIKIFGAEGWTPLWTKLASPEQAAKVRETMLKPGKFATYIPFPTLAADHPKFTPDQGYWRGPVWLDQAYFAIKGLENYGYQEDADRFTTHLLDRLEGLKNSDLPIRENYHPLTGAAMESKHFSWSAAHILLLLTGE